MIIDDMVKDEIRVWCSTSNGTSSTFKSLTEAVAPS